MAGTNPTFSCKNSELRVSSVCNNCRNRHLRCSGSPVCIRCAKESTPCVFRPSRQGQRTMAVVAVDSGSPPLSGTTCLNCRARHLKCTGGPLCLRCGRDGIPCLFKRSHRGQRKPKLPVKLIWTAPISVQYSSPTKFSFLSCEAFTDKKALRSFAYFREKTSPKLSAYQDHSFWNSLILQISHDQPAIKCLLAAVGSLHEALEVGYSTFCNEDAQPLHIYALKQQGQGIRLLKDCDHLPAETVLISSILLICFEALQRSFSSLIATLRMSFRVLKDRCEQSSTGDEIIAEFSRLSMQASMFLDYFSIIQNPRSLTLASKQRCPDQIIELPKSFTSLSHAAACLDSVMTQGCIHEDAVVCNPDYDLIAFRLASLQTLLNSWSDLLSKFLNKAHHISIQFLRESVSLKIRYHIAFITASPLQHQGELRYDSYLSNFESIIFLSMQWLDLNSSSEALPEIVTCSIAGGEHNAGILSGLMLSTLHCRCPDLRRQALGVLNREDCREEGTWVSQTAAKVAEHMIALEEQGIAHPKSCADIPQANRVRLLRVSRPTGIFSPYDQPGGPHAYSSGIWSIPKARSELRFYEPPRQLVLRYVQAPCDVNSAIEEVCFDL